MARGLPFLQATPKAEDALFSPCCLSGLGDAPNCTHIRVRTSNCTSQCAFHVGAAYHSVGGGVSQVKSSCHSEIKQTDKGRAQLLRWAEQ